MELVHSNQKFLRQEITLFLAELEHPTTQPCRELQWPPPTSLEPCASSSLSTQHTLMTKSFLPLPELELNQPSPMLIGIVDSPPQEWTSPITLSVMDVSMLLLPSDKLFSMLFKIQPN